MHSSCKNATYDEYKEIATRLEQPRIKGNQTSTTLLREMNKPPSLQVVQESKWTQAAPATLKEMIKLFLFAVIKNYYKGYNLPLKAHSCQPSMKSLPCYMVCPAVCDTCFCVTIAQIKHQASLLW